LFVCRRYLGSEGALDQLIYKSLYPNKPT
jgi:hypothetical protein